MPLFHPSGSLVYHWRAWRWRTTLWALFHGEVHRWLRDWQPDTRHLVLVGPSGGYALDPNFLARFSRLTVLDPDPLASRIFARHFQRRDFPKQTLAWQSESHLAEAEGFRWLADRWPDAAFLFCNLLGQTLVGAPPGFARRPWLDRLPTVLAGRQWASWHDLAAVEQAPARQFGIDLPRSEALETSLARFWQGRGPGNELAIHDCECGGLLPDSPRRLAVWSLTTSRHHLIEWLEAGR